MSKYVGRHRAAVTPRTPVTRTVLGASAVAAVGLAIPTAAEAAPVAAAPAAVAPAAPSLVTYTSFRGLVQMGDRGSLVKLVQRKVGVSADGVFGPQTRAAVQRYQRRAGLAADGVVGPRTGSRMNLPSGATARSSRSTARTSVASSSIVSSAARFYGTRYVWGGTTPAGFDCSGFTSYVYRMHGKYLPRTAEQQRQATRRVYSPQAGDLVFFGYPAYHVGIYAGNGQIIDAGRSGGTVTRRSIWTSNVSYGRL